MNLTKEQVFSISSREEFNAVALQVFRHQATNCAVYRAFIEGLRVDVDHVKTIEQIPFLPVEFFKQHTIVSTTDGAEVIFTSSGTTGMVTSRHVVTDVSWS